MPVTGLPKFDCLVVSELSAELRGTTAMLSCKAAFVNLQTGETHAWTKGDGALWSHETVQRLKDLRSSMEADLGKLHFGDTALAVTEGQPNHQPAVSRVPLGGIGEHIGQDADQA